MTRLLSEHDGQHQARILRSLADDLEEGTRKRGAITRANSWDGNLRGASLDPGRGGDHDPTGQAATSRTDWTSHIAADIAKAAEDTMRAAQRCANLIARIPAPVESTDDTDAMTARIELARQNLRAGDCEVCGRTCLGERDDRLTHLVVPWTVWSKGVETEHREERDVCNPCRLSWGRAKARGEEFTEWERRRRLGLERESA